MGVKQGSTPRADVLHGELDDAIFAASFGKLVRDEGPRIYRDPTQFFQNTHPTAALSRLCRDVFGRLGTTSDAGTVLRLSTGFGGGKTHALMALWHLAGCASIDGKGWCCRTWSVAFATRPPLGLSG